MLFSIRNLKWVKYLISSASSFTQAIAKSILLFVLLLYISRFGIYIIRVTIVK